MSGLQVHRYTWLLATIFVLFGQTSKAHWGPSWFQSHDGSVETLSRADKLSDTSTYSQHQFQDAERSLKTLEDAHVCKRDATLQLIGSSTCKDLLQEPRRGDVETLLDVYAIELAKCEIESASVKLPRACQFEFPSDHLDNGVRSTLQADLSRCLGALHSKPQWWTSYSNHRRDGYQWCLIMKPGFDNNEHVKVWRNVYSALDISVSAIKESLHGIMSWSQQSRGSLNDLGEFITSILDNFKSRVDHGLKDVEARFAESSNNMQDHIDRLHDGLLDTEGKLKDVVLVTDSSVAIVRSMDGNLATLSSLQRTQLQQAGIVSAELQIIQQLAETTRLNVTSEQAIIMDKFSTMIQTSEQLKQGFSDANDQIQNLNVALAALASFSGFWQFLRWMIPVVLVALVSRQSAVYIAIAVLCYQEISSSFHTLGLDFGSRILDHVRHIYVSQRIMRIVLIVVLCWYLLCKLKPRWARILYRYPWCQYPDQENQRYMLQQSSYYDTACHHKENKSRFFSNHYHSRVHHTPQYPYGRRFDREQSSPL